MSGLCFLARVSTGISTCSFGKNVVIFRNTRREHEDFINQEHGKGSALVGFFNTSVTRSFARIQGRK
jgi:hypothetical protein